MSTPADRIGQEEIEAANERLREHNQRLLASRCPNCDERLRVNVGLIAENKMLRRLHNDRSGFERQVAGALRSAIDAHGSLQPRQVGSASKRIVKQVYGWLREQMDEDIRAALNNLRAGESRRGSGPLAKNPAVATDAPQPQDPALSAAAAARQEPDWEKIARELYQAAKAVGVQDGAAGGRLDAALEAFESFAGAQGALAAFERSSRRGEQEG